MNSDGTKQKLLTTLLSQYREVDPHRILGLHTVGNDQMIRLWYPGVEKAVFLEIGGKIVEAQKVGSIGLFEVLLKERIEKDNYRIYHSDGTLQYDPYSFAPLLSEKEAQLYNEGKHESPYKALGAHLCVVEGIQGVSFRVWAPEANSVSLVGPFNQWDGRFYPMRLIGQSGIWELFVPGLMEGTKYKFEIHTKKGSLLIKSDPYAFYAQLRPNNASIVFDIDRYAWNDQTWMKERSQLPFERPLNIYEVHLASWRNYGVEFPNYRQIAPDLGQYCKEMGFTHVEILPIMEHPLDESWGYQVTGFYAATSRYGTPEDFQWFVDHLHQMGIGIILDWVPGHFPTDDFSLHRFDGTPLYEHEDPRQGMHPHWNTAIFNYGSKEVTNFLIGNALFWFEKMHIDGLRVDAVASMLYLDFGRNPGEWIPNIEGGNLNLEAIAFLKKLNSMVHQKFSDVLMIAEESSSFLGVTRAPEQGGLGFDLKWNMGWMNDTLRYFSRDPIFRKYHQNDLSFSLLYTFTENFLLVLSHDEVVHMKGSLIAKMPGSDPQKFANVRLLYSYLIGHPGKKLFFMGGEIGQWNEWNCKGILEWDLLQYPLHKGLYTCIKELNYLYRDHPALWSSDAQGYEWIDYNDTERCIISYLRKGGEKYAVFVHNLTPEVRENYWVTLGNIKKIREILNTDHLRYGGSNRLNEQIEFSSAGFSVNLPPLATTIFEVEF